MIRQLIQYITLTFEVMKLNILSAMEYRLSFISQTVGMALNDALWLYMWLVFFIKFREINGWNFQDTMLLFSLAMANFGIFRIFAGNTEEIAHDINRGYLDYFMTLPKSVLWQVSTAQSNISAIGDFSFGVGLFLLQGLGLEKFFVFIGVAALSSLVLYNFMVIVQSTGFFVSNFEETGDRVFHLMLGMSLYPATS